MTDMEIAWIAGQEYQGNHPEIACQDLNGKMPQGCSQKLQQEFMDGYASMNPVDYDEDF